MEHLRLAEGEYRFARIVWENEPLPSGKLVELSQKELGWKKSTTYTVLKKLVERGVLRERGGHRRHPPGGDPPGGEPRGGGAHL